MRFAATLMAGGGRACNTIFFRAPPRPTTLETTQGRIDGFFSQLPFKCYLPEVASVGYCFKICPWVASRVAQRGHQGIFGGRATEHWIGNQKEQPYALHGRSGCVLWCTSSSFESQAPVVSYRACETESTEGELVFLPWCALVGREKWVVSLVIVLNASEREEGAFTLVALATLSSSAVVSPGWKSDCGAASPPSDAPMSNPWRSPIMARSFMRPPLASPAPRSRDRSPTPRTEPGATLFTAQFGPRMARPVEGFTRARNSSTSPAGTFLLSVTPPRGR